MTTETPPQMAVPEDMRDACKHYGFNDEQDLERVGNASKRREVQHLAETFARRRLQADNLRKALKQIAYLRPAGDISSARNTRQLVERIEVIAMRAIEQDKPNE